MRQSTMLSLAALFLLLALSISSLTADSGGKIPVTSSSKEALAEFIEGQTLVDNLRLTDAIPHFQKAVQIDPGFALGYLYLAQSAPTAKDFFAALDKAAALASHASKGEQLWIKGFKAGAYGDPSGQRKSFEELVQTFPGDERAQTLLGTSFFGQQDYVKAIEHLKKAVDMKPDFAPAYNQLGYAYRFVNQYSEAEKTFKRYTELLPDDPNPYDSYAELLLKMGRFDEAIAQYRKALSINPFFANSFTGIAAALMYENKHEEARAELQKAYTVARNDGEKRASLFCRAVAYVDEGNSSLALKELEQQKAVAMNINDAAAMGGDEVAMGNILLQTGKADEALAKYNEGLALITKANLAKEVKENATLISHYNAARAYVVKGDLATAKAEGEKLRAGATAKKNQNQIRLAHEVAGTIALAAKEYSKAIEELKQANQQDPNVLYHLALAYQATGNASEARKYCIGAARFNGLPALNIAFVRQKAEKLLATL